MHHKLIAYSTESNLTGATRGTFLPKRATHWVQQIPLVLLLLNSASAEEVMIPSDPIYCTPNWASLANSGPENFWSVVQPFFKQGFLETDMTCASDLLENVCQAVLGNNIPTCTTQDCNHFQSLIEQPSSQYPLSLEGYKGAIFNQTFLIANHTQCQSAAPSLDSIFNKCEAIRNGPIAILGIIFAVVGSIALGILVLGGIIRACQSVINCCKRLRHPEEMPLLNHPVHPQNPAPQQPPAHHILHIQPTISDNSLHISRSDSSDPYVKDEEFPFESDQKAI